MLNREKIFKEKRVRYTRIVPVENLIELENNAWKVSCNTSKFYIWLTFEEQDFEKRAHMDSLKIEFLVTFMRPSPHSSIAYKIK